MRFTNCVLCKQGVITSNCIDGICRDCRDRIDEGDDLTYKAYMEHDTFLEVFPKPKGRGL